MRVRQAIKLLFVFYVLWILASSTPCQGDRQPYDVAEIKYDNEVPSGSGYGNALDTGVGVRFTPPCVPGELAGAKIYFLNLGAGGNTGTYSFTLRVEDALHNTLVSLLVTFTAHTDNLPPLDATIVYVDLKSHHIMVSGDFYIFAINHRCIWVDTSPVGSWRNYFYDGQNYIQYEKYGEDNYRYGNLMIRAYLAERWSLLDGPTPDAPALASSSSLLFLAARGMDNGIWYRSMGSSGTWSSWSRLPGFTDARPAIAVFNSRLYFFCKQLGANSIWYGSYPLSGGVVSGAFSGWSPLDGLTPSAVSLASSPDYLYLAARGMDGSIWHRRMSIMPSGPVWSGWSRVLGFTDVSPAIAVFNNRLYFACKQSGASLIWYGYVDLGSYPAAWYGWSPLDGLTPDALTLASSSDYLYLVARSVDKSIWYRTMSSTGVWEYWSGWSPASGYTESPVAIAIFNWYMHLAARQAGTNNLWIYR